MRPRDLGPERTHQRRVDGFALSLSEGGTGSALMTKGVEGVTDHLRVLAWRQQAKDGHLGARQSLRQGLGLAHQELAGSLDAAAEALSPVAARRARCRPRRARAHLGPARETVMNFAHRISA
jgi:hypothetical protein